jgi:hypothetical protein
MSRIPCAFTAPALGVLLALASSLGCSGTRPPAPDRAVAPVAASTADVAAPAAAGPVAARATAAAADTGPCFRLAANPIEVGTAPQVEFDAPLQPPPNDSYWVEAVPAAHPEHISRRWNKVEAGATRATLPKLPYAAAWEVRLHTSYPEKDKYVVCRRPLTVTEIPPERIPVRLEALAQFDDQAAKAFAAAVPAGSADAKSTRRWEVSGLPGVARLVLGRYRGPAGPRPALVVQGAGTGPGHRVDLPGTEGATLMHLVDLQADPERALLHTYPTKGGGRPTAAAVPAGARAPAVMLAADTERPGLSRRDLVVVLLGPGKPRLVLEFPLASSGGSDGSFSTIKGPDLYKSSGPMLDVVVGQHGHPRVPTGLPGPITPFTCRWDGAKYTCGRR